jgi:hypothetical protein
MAHKFKIGCPYTVGAKFALRLSVPPYASQKNAEYPIRVKVLQVNPFTSSQTMKVAILDKPEDSELPSVAFLKLYDHRYLYNPFEVDDSSDDDFFPWEDAPKHSDIKKEGALETKDDIEANNGIGKNGTQDHVITAGDDEQVTEPEISQPSHFRNHLDSDPLDDGCSTEEEDYGKDLKPKRTMFMSHHFADKIKSHDMKICIETESEVYRLLQPLQGQIIPKYYGATAFSGEIHPTGIEKEVRGILLEYIDGEPLHKIDDKNLFVSGVYIGWIVTHCFEKIISLGVQHEDLGLTNIMVRKDGTVVFLDFAVVTIRGPLYSNQSWYASCAFNQGIMMVKRFLDQKLHRLLNS